MLTPSALTSRLDMANLSLNDNDGSSGASDQDTLAPLPLPGASPWPMMHTFPYQPYPTHAFSSQPPPYHELSSYSYAPGSTGSQHSEGKRSCETGVSFHLNQFAVLLKFSSSPQAAEAVGPRGARVTGAARLKVLAALWAEVINPPQQVEREEEQTRVLAAVVNQNTLPAAA